MKPLQDLIVVVTGGAGLIGKEIIKTIINQGGIGIIADIDDEIGERAKKKLSTETGSDCIEYLNMDITDKKAIQETIDYLDSKYGKIDALINNAYPKNKNHGRAFYEIEYDDFCDILSAHIGGCFLTSQKFSRYFQKQGYGNIVNIASIYGVVAPRFELYEGLEITCEPEYVAVKAAIIHLTRYMAQYFKNKNIRVNAISPGGILNNQDGKFLARYSAYCLSKGMLDVADLNGTLVFLLSDMSKYVNGQNIIVDDGFVL